MMKGLMGWCLKNEAALERVRFKAKQTEDELNQLQIWKTTMEKKFKLSERERKELEQSMGEAKTALEGKETKITNLKDGLCQAKEVAVREYCDSNALLSELGDSFLQGLEDALHQVKKAYPDLDASNIKMEDQAQTFVLPIASDDMDDLFAEANSQGEGESTLAQPITERLTSPSPNPLLQLSSRQPSNPSLNSRRTLQPRYSYLHVFTYFFHAFFVFGEQSLSVIDNV